MVKSKIILEGEAKLLPKKGLEGFCFVDEQGKELNFENIAEKAYYHHSNSYVFNTTIKYKIIIDRADK